MQTSMLSGALIFSDLLYNIYQSERFNLKAKNIILKRFKVVFENSKQIKPLWSLNHVYAGFSTIQNYEGMVKSRIKKGHDKRGSSVIFHSGLYI